MKGLVIFFYIVLICALLAAFGLAIYAGFKISVWVGLGVIGAILLISAIIIVFIITQYKIFLGAKKNKNGQDN